MSDYDPTLNPNNVIPAYDATQSIDAQMDSFDPDVSKPNTAEALKLPPALVDAMTDYAKAVQIARESERTLAQKQAEYLGILQREAEISRLKSAVDTPVSAWCADYTTGLTGTVATLEVPGEVDPTIGGGLNIRPGFNSNAAWDANYGQIQPGMILSPAGFAWNLTMTMPWMKWNPIWRYATVTAKNEAADTVNVTLHPIVSKASVYLGRQTDFNDPWQTSMVDVPVEYMSCGAKIFEIGDEVIVQFSRTGSGGLEFFDPKVIGFKEEPKVCDLIFLANNAGEIYEGTASLTSPLNWTLSTRFGGTASVILAQDGWIIGWKNVDGGKIYRETSAGVVWSIETGDYFGTMNYDPFNNRLITSDWDTGLARFFDPATGALLGQTQLGSNTGQAGRLQGTGVNSETGELIYAVAGLADDPQTIHIGSSSISLSSVHPGDTSNIQGLCCSLDFIFVLVFNYLEGSTPHLVLQLTKSGSLVASVPTVGIGSDSYSWNGERISGGGMAPALPPPDPEP